MRTESVIKYFGTQKATGKALGIRQSSVAEWNEYPPDLRQIQLERLTKGELKAEPGILPKEAVRAPVARIRGTPTDTALEESQAMAAFNLVERRLARAHMNERNLRLRNAHLRLALDLIAQKPSAIAALAEARERVALWAREKTCSPFYINTWRKVLHGTPTTVGKGLSNFEPRWELALMQNSPFVSLLRAAVTPVAA